MSTTTEEAISSTSSSEWEWLPSHLLDSILEKLIPISEHIRFSVVCKHWQSAALHQKQRRIKSCHKQLPMLMIPTSDNDRRSLYNVSQGKTYGFELNVPYKERCCGSSRGWLAFVETVDENLELTLLNPFTRRAIRLPHVQLLKQPLEDEEEYMWEHYPEHSIHKVVLSADPCLFPNDYEVLIIYDRSGAKIAHYNPGDDVWTYIDKGMGFTDAVYYKGQFLAVTFEGLVFSVNVSSDSTTKPYIGTLAAEHVPQGISYLAESSWGDLLLIRKFEQTDYELFYEVNTTSFKVFKLQCATGDRPGSVEEIESIGDDALFLGHNESICVSALDFLGCHPNFVYFSIDDGWDGLPEKQNQELAMAAFNVENGRMETHYYDDFPSDDLLPSIWILPTMV